MDDMADDTTNDAPAAGPKSSYRSSVDTSRPFSSVKEAVAIFGERFLVRDMIYQQQPPISTHSPSWKSASASPSPSPAPSLLREDHVITQDPKVLDGERGTPSDGVLMESVRRLEAELEETKAALKQLKEQGSETDIALASLNAELHLNMAKMARAEAAAAKKAADGGKEGAAGDNNQLMVMRMVGSPTLAEILNLGSEMSSNPNKKAKAKKKKKRPIVPLVGDLLYWKKKQKDSNNSAALNDNPFYGSPHVFW